MDVRIEFFFVCSFLKNSLNAGDEPLLWSTCRYNFEMLQLVPSPKDPSVSLDEQPLVSSLAVSSKALNQVDQRLRKIVENAPIVVWAIDPDGMFTLSTGAALAGLGLKPGEVEGQSAFDLYAESPRILEDLRRGLAGEEFKSESTVAGRVFESHHCPILNEEKAVVGLLGVSMDMTERHRAEIQRLRGQEQLLQAQKIESSRVEKLRSQKEVLLHLALRDELYQPDFKPALQIICEEAGKHLHVQRTSVWTYNKDNSGIRCLNLYEHDTNRHSEGAELFARDFPAYFEALAQERVIAAHDAHADHRTREFSEAYLKPQGITSMLDAPIRSTGEAGLRIRGVICHEHVGPYRVWDEEEQGFAGSIGDLAALVIAAEERRRIQGQLLQAQKLESVGLLAGGIAHDFNNLLTTILGGASSAMLELADDHPARENVENVVLASRRAADLTRQLLAYSGKGHFKVEAIDISSVVTELGTLLEATVAKNVRLELDVLPDTPAIEADVAQMHQVLMNLIINAAESIGDRQGTVYVRTGVEEIDELPPTDGFVTEILTTGPHVFVEIKDTGCGMSSETLSKIFDPYFSTKFTGRGLGLAAVLGIVRGQKGALCVRSTLGKGSTFKVLFPVCEEAVIPEAAQTDNFSGSGVALVVDDDHTVRMVASHMLKQLGFSIVEADNGRTGVEQLIAHRKEVAFILLDIAMPVLSGDKAFAEMRKIAPDLPIILTSGFNEREATRRFTSRRYSTFLQKPFTPQDVAAKLTELFASEVET
jgi:PAS domain S-box-containing protein